MGNDVLSGNQMKNVRNNICLTQNMKYNQIKSRDPSLFDSEEKQQQILTNGHNDDDMSSVASEFVCNEHMFAPEEEDEIKMEINDKYAAFNGIEGKQKRKITDYYNKENNHNNHNNSAENDFYRVSPPTTPKRNQSENEIINTLGVRRKKKENVKSSKKKKKKNNRKNGKNESNDFEKRND